MTLRYYRQLLTLTLLLISDYAVCKGFDKNELLIYAEKGDYRFDPFTALDSDADGKVKDNIYSVAFSSPLS